MAQKVTEVDGIRLTPHGQSVAREIKRHFPDAPFMLYVANCESRGLVHRDHGGRLRPHSGGKSTAAGVFQVLLGLHGPDMRKRGLDPEVLSDYLTYVRELYDRHGLKPWQASRKCWGKHYQQLAAL